MPPSVDLAREWAPAEGDVVNHTEGVFAEIGHPHVRRVQRSPGWVSASQRRNSLTVNASLRRAVSGRRVARLQAAAAGAVLPGSNRARDASAACDERLRLSVAKPLGAKRGVVSPEGIEPSTNRLRVLIRVSARVHRCDFLR